MMLALMHSCITAFSSILRPIHARRHAALHASTACGFLAFETYIPNLEPPDSKTDALKSQSRGQAFAQSPAAASPGKVAGFLYVFPAQGLGVRPG